MEIKLVSKDGSKFSLEFNINSGLSWLCKLQCLSINYQNLFLYIKISFIIHKIFDKGKDVIKRVNWFSSLPNKYKQIIIDKIQNSDIELDSDNFYQILIKGKLSFSVLLHIQSLFDEK